MSLVRTCRFPLAFLPKGYVEKIEEIIQVQSEWILKEKSHLVDGTHYIRKLINKANKISVNPFFPANHYIREEDKIERFQMYTNPPLPFECSDFYVYLSKRHIQIYKIEMMEKYTKERRILKELNYIKLHLIPLLLLFCNFLYNIWN